MYADSLGIWTHSESIVQKNEGKFNKGRPKNVHDYDG